LGADFLGYARRAVGEPLPVGHEGSLMLWNESMKRFWRTEDSINWMH
jgi:hypothetical protein